MRREADKIKEFIERIQTLSQYRKRVSHIEYLPARGSHYKEPVHPLPQKLQKALESLGINKLYSHQAEALDLIREGRNVAIVTPTASGKTLAFNLPVLEKILADNESKALYLFPTKALTQDQMKSIKQLFKAVGGDFQAEIYDGDTTPYRRSKIRKKMPNIIMSNPDMLHAAILAHHSAWADFFKNLKFVIVDEIHSYKGIFGCHVAHILRRLRRVCSYYGSNPQFILCSATMANPEEFVGQLTGLEHEIIKESGRGSC
ncbi:MAG: DEAD/DEAH box helicase [Nitrospirae bacterium]|nr:DEAD/DEAH box helicase [Nitrospirota bacterium]